MDKQQQYLFDWTLEVAGKMGDGWTAESDPHLDCVCHLAHRDGLRLSVSGGWGFINHLPDVRFTLEAEYPDSEGHSLYYDKPKGITVAAGRAAADLARDINRRLVPIAQEWHKQQVDRLQGRREYRAWVNQQARRWAILSGGEVRHEDTDSPEVSYWPSLLNQLYPNFEIKGWREGLVDIAISGLKEKYAERVAAILKEAAAEES